MLTEHGDRRIQHLLLVKFLWSRHGWKLPNA
jgi:hypothetical protein